VHKAKRRISSSTLPLVKHDHSENTVRESLESIFIHLF